MEFLSQMTTCKCNKKSSALKRNDCEASVPAVNLKFLRKYLLKSSCWDQKPLCAGLGLGGKMVGFVVHEAFTA